MVPMTRNILFRHQKLTFFSPEPEILHSTECESSYWHQPALTEALRFYTRTSDHSASLHEKVIATQARLRSAGSPPNPSKRTPNRFATSNTPDRLEKALNEACFHSWGFHIYRCTYQSDSDWEEFLRRYRWHVADSLKYENGLDLLESFKMTVFENQALFEGVDISTGTATVREHFQKWATIAIQEDQSVSPDMLVFAKVEAARYRFCLFVNEKSLQGVLQAPLEDCFNENAFVNMLNGWWKKSHLTITIPKI
ncbi:uncharacterized protein PGRI_087200 [Penicillium griseofulvum]|uniref:Uncharacterized protein n=1 Tax=Penicillium patulum TaxID=5078 RepID=A0A135LU23_PENPA|nr:uncharacterized protein PGRI_087200 [Penicillium griseofulvum]KXG52436.1 hypothetical protein PGRI_087200 [Penicillium griseofulvum]